MIRVKPIYLRTLHKCCYFTIVSDFPFSFRIIYHNFLAALCYGLLISQFYGVSMDGLLSQILSLLLLNLTKKKGHQIGICQHLHKACELNIILLSALLIKKSLFIQLLSIILFIIVVNLQSNMYF